MGRTDQVVTVPPQYPTASIFIDESGSKSTAGGEFFVVASVKVRRPGLLTRAILDVRNKADFYNEFKFSGINRGSLPIFHQVIDALHESDATLAACVVQGSLYNPFRQGKPSWMVHAEVTTQLLVGCINRRELVGVHLDGISTPLGCSLEEEVRRRTNQRLKATSVISAVCLDSKTCDLLQVADLVAGAIFHERRRAAVGDTRPRSVKGNVALRLATVFECPGLTDGRTDRVNIRTYTGPRTTTRTLRAVKPLQVG